MKARPQHNDGAALVVVLSFTFLASVLGASLLMTSASHARVAASQVNLERALFIAEAGVERAAQEIEDAAGYLAASTTGSGNLGGGSYDYVITRVGWRTYSLVSVGTVNGASRQIDIPQIYMPTYAQYALWMHQNGHIYFIGGEVFDGHVHSNDKLWFASQGGVGPVFHEVCSTARDTYGGSLNNVVFDKGFEMNATEGSMANVDFAQLESLAGSFGTVLEGYTSVEFVGDRMKITNPDAGMNNQYVDIQPNDILYVKSKGNHGSDRGRVYLEGGTVDGRITIVSDEDIYIRDHTRYYDDPRVNPDSDNALGLISKDDVWVSTSAPDNLNVDAAILATGAAPGRGSFGVLDYHRGSPRGALNVYGSIVQDKRGAVGTFSHYGSATGYYKNYAFDPRFATASPPYYPVVDDKIRYVGWSEGPVTP